LKIGPSGAEKNHRRTPEAGRKASSDKRGLHSLARIRHAHRVFARRSYRTIPGPALQLNNSTLREIGQRVRCLSSDQLLERFHCLIGKRLNGTIKLMEALELERIDARFDSEERAEMDRVTEFREAWAAERSELLASIERLIAGLKAG